MYKKISAIYILTFPNGKQYVGQTTNVGLRFNDYRNSKKGKTPIYNAIRKYGWQNVSIWKKECKEENLDKAEIGLIKSLDTVLPNGYNMQNGGSKRKHHNEKSNRQNARAHRGMYIGKDNPFYGKHHSNESIERMSLAKKGRYKGTHNPNYGNHKLAGISNPMYGSHRIDHSAKPILQFSSDGQLIREWSSAVQVRKELHINAASISMACKGKQNTAGGFIWRYK